MKSKYSLVLKATACMDRPIFVFFECVTIGLTSSFSATAPARIPIHPRMYPIHNEGNFIFLCSSKSDKLMNDFFLTSLGRHFSSNWAHLLYFGVLRWVQQVPSKLRSAPGFYISFIPATLMQLWSVYWCRWCAWNSFHSNHNHEVWRHALFVGLNEIFRMPLYYYNVIPLKGDET